MMNRRSIKVGVVSLGCDKNRVDTERMLAKLQNHGYTLTSEPDKADVIIVNTCAFIQPAVKESLDTIFEMASYKEDNCKKLVVTGCLPQRFMEDLQSELYEADCFLGVGDCNYITSSLDKLLDFTAGPEVEAKRPSKERVLSTPAHYAYLKIADGCDNFCTYCTIPSIRGKYVSQPIEQLVQEAQTLVDEGVRELILVAQDVTAYGKDIYGNQALPSLVNELSKIDKLRWIRLLYCYPERIDDNIIEMMKNPKVVKYLDIPLQHVSDSVLKRMGRRSTASGIHSLLKKLRTEIPEITLRSTFIVGFPGETESDFEELLEFLRTARMDNVGFFAYSPEEGTPAASLNGAIPEDEKKWRLEQAYECQESVAEEVSAAYVGKIIPIVIDKLSCRKGRIYEYLARGERNAPDIDGVVIARSKKPLESGEFHTVLISKINTYNLIGEVIT